MVLSGTAAVMVVQPGTALLTELPEPECSGRDSNPRPVDEESITGAVPARSRRYVAVVRCGRDAESNRNGARVCNRSLQITEPLRPATILLLEQARQGSNPDQRGWSSPCFRLHHGPVQSGRPGSNGSPRSGAPVLFRLSYVREVVRPAGVEPAASAVAGQRSLR